MSRTASIIGEPVAANCEHWNDGKCEKCGVQWQFCEVGESYRCPYFSQRISPSCTLSSHDYRTQGNE